MRKLLALSAFAVVANVALGVPALAAARCKWVMVQSATGGSDTQLYGVSATAPSDVWAVGQSNGGSQTFSEHYDGYAWSAVSIPTFGDGELASVSALNPSDAWAVGFAEGQTGLGLALHWNGSTWTSVDTPKSRYTFGDIVSVVTLSPSDVWAVGFAQKRTALVTLALHWNGRRWSVVPTPNAGKIDQLDAVAATGPNDVWAVGSSSRDSGLKARALIEHWNGQAWSLVPVPRHGDTNVLNAVTAITPSDAWAVGYTNNPGRGVRTLAEHWNGSEWSVVRTPENGDFTQLSGVAASAGSVWAVGFSSATGTLAMRWNGLRWHIAKTPYVSSGEFSAITAVPNSLEFWAVGVEGPGSMPLTERLTCT